MSRFPTPFDFDKVMAFAGAAIDGSPYQYLYTSVPTDATSYAANITWYDTRPQPSWASIAPPSGPSWIAYDAWYQFHTYGYIGDISAAIDVVAAQIPAVSTAGLSGSYLDLTNKPAIPLAPRAYEGTNLRTNVMSAVMSATVASGSAVFQLTQNGLATGTAMFPNGVIPDSVSLQVNDSTASYQMAWVFSNSNKTLTVTANKLTTSNILTGVLGQAAANAAVVKLTVWGY